VVPHLALGLPKDARELFGASRPLMQGGQDFDPDPVAKTSARNFLDAPAASFSRASTAVPPVTYLASFTWPISSWSGLYELKRSL